MINARGRKVIADLWVNKTRTLLVIFTIMTSLAAVGLILNGRTIIVTSIEQSMAEIVPANVRLDSDPFTADVLETARAHPDVGDADARYRLDVRAYSTEGEWRNLRIFAIPDFDNMQINKILPQAGAWPPPVGELALERATMRYLGVELGDTVIVETPQGTQLEMIVGSSIHDPYQITPLIGNEGYGYITTDTLAVMGEPTDLYNELYLIGNRRFSEKSESQALGVAVRNGVMAPAGAKIFRAVIFEPNEHPLGSLINMLLTLLVVLGITTLFMSGFLVLNTVAAMMAEQTRQMGVMKAMGARSKQLVSMYLALAVLFGLFSLLLGIPLSLLGGIGLSRVILNLLNLDPVNIGFPVNVIIIEGIIGLLLPLLAALLPVFQSTRMTVLEAISDYGLDSKKVGVSFLSRFIERTQILSRPTLLAFRNISRHRVRLGLTLASLGLGGAMFISMLVLSASMGVAVDDMAKYWQYAVEINFNEMVDAAELEEFVSDVPEVTAVEGWITKEAFYVRADGTENENLWLFAPASGSKLIQPTVREGRWLVPDDQDKVVVNTDFLREEENVTVGDTIQIKVDSQLTEWEVVGIVTGQISGSVMYVNRPALAQTLGAPGMVNRIVVETAVLDEATETRVRQAVEERLRQHDISIGISSTNTELRAKLEGVINMFTAIIFVMIFLLAVTGGLSVAGTMSLNVLERTKEIGILRAIGASSKVIGKLILFEALFIGLLSWLLGIIIGIPLSKFLNHMSGVGFIGAPLTYTLSISTIGLWFVLAVVSAILASLLPARRAAALSIRDALAYE